MMRRTKRFIGLGILFAGLAGNWSAATQTVHPVQAEPAEPSKDGGSGILDGLTFSGKLGPLGKPADVADTLVFANGTFLSLECDRRCGYPPAPYFVRHVDNKIEFVSESRCTNADATLVWRGTVDNGTIKGRLHWRSVRWYWTIEKDFWFEGTAARAAGQVTKSR